MKRTGKVLALLMTIILLVAASSGFLSASETEEKTIKMGYFEFGGMFEGAGEDKDKSGYCYEYMMQVATYTGWNYEFCYGTYAELYEKLRAGEIDILPYTNFNDERAQEVLFSDKVLAEEEYYIATLSNETGQTGLYDGAVISTLEGADYNGLLTEYITENGYNVTLKYYPDLYETWDAVINGEADATVFTSNAYSGERWIRICSFGKKPTYIAVAKNRTDILNALNEATAQIDIDNPALLGELYSAYFSDNPMRRSLSDDELAWLGGHPVIHIGCFANDAPYILSYDNDKLTASGMTPDIVAGIISRLNLGIKADYKCYNSLEEMEAALDAGEIDMIMPFYPNHNVAQQHNLVISNTVRVSNMELVYKKGMTYVKALRKVATPETKLGIYYVRDTFPNSEIVGASSIQDAVDKVRRGEATGAIAQNVVLHSIKEKYDDLNYVVLSEGCGTCFAARPENYILIRIMNRGLNYFTSAEISAIASQYTLETTVTTREYLATHKEAVVMLIVILVTLVALVIALIQVNHLKKKADVASRAKTNFLFNMSHDIRTPMNAITGFTNMAKKNIDNREKATEYLDKIDISGRQLLTLVNQVLEMSRIESGKIELEENPVDIRREFDYAVTVFSEQAKALGLEFNHSVEGIEHSNILADKARIASVTFNITGNAMKYTPRGGSIDFLLREIPAKKEGYAAFVFTVSDSGIGMSKDYMKVLYEPFTREKNSTVSKIQGAGLGMSIVKNLVDLMDGKIEVQSEPGKGTRFDITIEFKIDTEIRKENETNPVTVQKQLKGCRVLLAEDNELNREIAADILSEEGIIADEAENGEKALELLNEKGPDYYDCILMDIQMPVMDGYEATKKIRKKYPDAKLPIIALSANAFAEDRNKSLDAGMNDHVAKPIDAEKLKEVLANYL